MQNEGDTGEQRCLELAPFCWQYSASRMDTEWIAFRAGVKPAIQRGVSGDAEAEETTARLRAEGLSVAHCDPSAGRLILYIAEGQADADALRDAEAPLLCEDISVKREAAALEEVGRRLGYPECCIAARIVRNRRRRMIKSLHVAHEDYRGAVDAWVANPAWELNRFAFPNEAFLITFEPCTYNCSAALDLARRVLLVVKEKSSGNVDEYIEKLQRPFLVGRGFEQWAFAVLDRCGAETTVADATPLVPAAAAFAAELRGRPVGPRGAVGEAVLLDFAAGSPLR